MDKDDDADIYEDVAAHPTTLRKYEKGKEAKKEDDEYAVLKKGLSVRSVFNGCYLGPPIYLAHNINIISGKVM